MNDTKYCDAKNKKNNNIAVKKKQTNVDWKVIDEIFKFLEVKNEQNRTTS